MPNMKTIQQNLLNWFHENARDLPWRKSYSPYHVWISEIMLQQTQVKTVIPYFNKFIKKYPNLKQLSEASEDEILASWSGLGFYRRARNIFASKETIKQKHKNRFPAEFEKIIALPGIGKSTAGAIMSLAYLKPQPILDGNVKRVIGRLLKRDINLLKERDHIISNISLQTNFVHYVPVPFYSYYNFLDLSWDEKVQIFFVSSKKLFECIIFHLTI